MNTKKIVKGELPAEAKTKTLNGGREYRRPEVHDLGKLELLQGGIGSESDGAHAYIYRP